MLSFLLALALMSGGAPETVQTRLTIEISNVRKASGTMRVGLYKPGFPFAREDAKPFTDKSQPVRKAGRVVVSFDLEPGTYAVALYHDQNDNNRMDKSVVGFPKEPYAFSNNFRPLLSGPDFKDCAFQVTEEGTVISIKLID